MLVTSLIELDDIARSKAAQNNIRSSTLTRSQLSAEGGTWLPLGTSSAIKRVLKYFNYQQTIVTVDHLCSGKFDLRFKIHELDKVVSRNTPEALRATEGQRANFSPSEILFTFFGVQRYIPDETDLSMGRKYRKLLCSASSFP